MNFPFIYRWQYLYLERYSHDLFDDGSHIVYVNGGYKENDAVGKLTHDFGCRGSKDMYYPELAKGVKHFKGEEGGRKAMCEAVEKYAEQEIAVKVKEERSLMSQIVAALVADKDDDAIVKELNCTLEQIIPLRTVMGKQISRHYHQPYYNYRNKNEERLVNIMGGTVIKTESDKIKIRTIVEMGQEVGLDDLGSKRRRKNDISRGV